MKKSSTLLSFSVSIVLAAFVAYGCGDDDNTVTTDGGTTSSSGSTSSGDTGASSSGDATPPNPAPPALGTQVDRFGRPAVNTAANNTFNSDTASQGTAKDAYNADSTQSGWVAAYTPEAAKNLAVYDGLDEVCGNQAFAADGGAGPVTNVQIYGTLAGVLADDRQWMNTAGTTDAQYLAVEANATGFAVNTDVGGRKLNFDVIDLTYSLLAAGVLSGVTDGISAVDAKTSGTTFPYLAAAQ